ncbi:MULTISPECIES: hypothetical protein [Pseudomonas]|uniref:hypothetical protein n=1 Tax=Pseudomonas TaxID=286 RepID=UPI00159FD26C|nr:MULTISPECIES: hypothetical protein [Pseudomonas]NVZ64794.1 hypothetical protein [Pseudomonas gingeri]NVZ74907.1 hypothetical protein [Pseudomonas gingeri]NWD06451.1 hypothetical protein [Pseudomonas gingeri]NWE32967.1 hypothetical protein [Pseudomonas gingeri]NWE55695.1 hypothetical protein [Pseudomonas gingeri]
MPKSFTQMVESSAGALLFTSSQDTIATFLGGPMMNYEGVCAALVMMWFAQNTAKTDPAKGIINKAKALNLQNKMEAGWAGLATVETQAKVTVGQHFWYRSTTKHEYTSKKYGADLKLQFDPLNKRESMSIFVIYFPSGAAHAIGVWRFPTGAMALYDPNEGACAIGKDNFREFLNTFLTELYDTTNGYAICAFYSDPKP